MTEQNEPTGEQSDRSGVHVSGSALAAVHRIHENGTRGESKPV